MAARIRELRRCGANAPGRRCWLARLHMIDGHEPVSHMIDIHRADPIFIQGVLPRSGTNFLWDLLLLHPDCTRGREPVNEDFFLEHSNHLTEFVEVVRGTWDPIWGTFGPDIQARLCEGIGEGLVSFLWTDR